MASLGEFMETRKTLSHGLDHIFQFIALFATVATTLFDYADVELCNRIAPIIVNCSERGANAATVDGTLKNGNWLSY